MLIKVSKTEFIETGKIIGLYRSSKGKLIVEMPEPCGAVIVDKELEHTFISHLVVFNNSEGIINKSESLWSLLP